VRYYFDIDGTLTDDPEDKWGNPYVERIDKVRSIIEQGHDVLIWSGNGTDYAKAFCEKYNLHPMCAIGKPDFYFDDKRDIRAPGKMVHLEPDDIIDFSL
jgi:phosphoserine phosphatase